MIITITTGPSPRLVPALAHCARMPPPSRSTARTPSPAAPLSLPGATQDPFVKPVRYRGFHSPDRTVAIVGLLFG